MCVPGTPVQQLLSKSTVSCVAVLLCFHHSIIYVPCCSICVPSTPIRRKPSVFLLADSRDVVSLLHVRTRYVDSAPANL
jgi:hypothetical protein